MRLSRALAWTYLERPWAADELTDRVSGLDEEEKVKMARNLCGSTRQEPRWGLIAGAEEPGDGQLRDYGLMTVEGR